MKGYETLLEDKSRTVNYVLIASIGLFIVSNWTIAFCTNAKCYASFEALLAGWLTLFGGGASFAWLANPFLYVSWVLLSKGKRSSWIIATVSFLLSISFLMVDTILTNENGRYEQIIQICTGYWFWLASIAVNLLGSLYIFFQPNVIKEAN